MQPYPQLTSIEEFVSQEFSKARFPHRMLLRRSTFANRRSQQAVRLPPHSTAANAALSVLPSHEQGPGSLHISATEFCTYYSTITELKVVVGSTVQTHQPQAIGPGVVVSRPASCPFSAASQSRRGPCLTGSRGYHNHITANVPRMHPIVVGCAFAPQNYQGSRGD